MLDTTSRRQLERRVHLFLEEHTLEEVFEYLDLDPDETIIQLYEAGLIDPDEFERIIY